VLKITTTWLLTLGSMHDREKARFRSCIAATMRTAAFGVLLAGGSLALDPAALPPRVLAAFSAFKARHGKVYASAGEETAKLAAFAANLARIEATNARPGLTYRAGLNQFSDLTRAEARAKLFFQKAAPAADATGGGGSYAYAYAAAASLPASVNWLEKGAVTGIKNQGQCGSCWIFSSTGAIESAHAIATGTLTSYSEQQMMGCVTSDPCNGGDDVQEYKYAHNATVCSEAFFPYRIPSGKPYPPPPPNVCPTNCTLDPSALARGKLTNWTTVAPMSEAALQAAVAVQPVSVSVDGSAVLDYASGILSGHCVAFPEWHAILVVGYGTTPPNGTDPAAGGIDYWLCKNSYGTTFGEGGYLRVRRNDPTCPEGGVGAIHILTRPAFPTVTV